MLDLVFNKKRADNRKEWLRTYQPNIYMDNTPEVIRIDDFINKELITFSVADNIRSIPSVIDGFKPAQRKVIYGCFKRKLKGQIKVTSLAGYVLENVAYHHGEQSLQATIINLAQHFVGSSNINVLTPEGQLGTRLMGGKDAASARYVQVSLPKLTRSIYHSSDDMLLKYLDDEGKIIEPEFFVPVVPMVLVNGTEGIGTGWSTNIPSYNPTDIVANIRRMMRGEEPLPMDPWFRGFQGTIEKVSPDKYRVSGNIAKISDDTLHITELPIRMWTDNYVAMLNQWRTGTEKEPPIIKDFVDNHTHTIIDFELKLTPEQMHKAEAEGFEKRFKLTTQISTTNFVCFDHQGRLHKYESTQEIFREFYQYRLKFYQLRKEYLANQLQRDYVILDNKARFVLEIIEKKLIVQNRKKDVLIKELRDRGYAPFSDKKPSVSTTAVIENPEDDNQERESDDEAASLEVPESKRDKDYDYLLSMPIWNLTYERFQKLLQERDERVKVLETLLAKAPEDLWNEDLDEFMKNWEGNLEEDAKILEEEWEEHLIALSGGSAKGKSKAAAAKKAKKSSNTEIKRRARELAQQQQRTITPASDLVDVKPKVALKSEANIGALATPAPAPPASASTTANTSAVPAGDAPGKRKQGTLDGFIKSKDGGDISLYDSSDSDDLPVLNFRERLEKRKAERNKLKQGSAETAGAGDDNNDPSAPSVANTGGDSKPASTGADTGRKKRQPLDTASLPKSRATASKPGRSNSTTATTTATIKNKGKKRSAKILESDSEGSGVDSTGEFEVDKPKSVAVSRPARGARATTAKSAPTYLEISDDDSDGGKFKDNDDDDDDASFNDDYSE
ncbi:DNA topoisomerase 2 [Spiromyces aspiralis]|uniref:DNA topoisomerase 2 n=1 Tax=Spiromyces aspiralis TaxID=68401 RepID=A0ACC1HJI7_9FUNG|nr:DNA topoisomerase 2 [Spiromyces aspiralis]